jgi:RNA polymerase sigma-70 factor (ECF subfamily)
MLNEPELTSRCRPQPAWTGPPIVADNENLASGAKLFRNRLLDRNRDRSMAQQANDPTLERLMQAAQSGDSRAYECLLSDITPRLRRMIQSQRRFLGPDEIEDILQDVLISMHSVRATYDPQRPFMPWLLAITRNRLADGGRKWARRAANEVLVDEVPVPLRTTGRIASREDNLTRRVFEKQCETFRPVSGKPWRCLSCARCR